MRTATDNAYDSILDVYTPLDIKDILTNGASRKAIHHKDCLLYTSPSPRD